MRIRAGAVVRKGEPDNEIADRRTVGFALDPGEELVGEESGAGTDGFDAVTVLENKRGCAVDRLRTIRVDRHIPAIGDDAIVPVCTERCRRGQSERGCRGKAMDGVIVGCERGVIA